VETHTFRVHPGALIRRSAALAVAILCVLPLHRLLSVERNGPAGADTLARADASWSLMLWGGVLVVLIGAVAALLARGRAAPSWFRGVETLALRLQSVDGRAFASGLALLAAGLASVIAVAVYDRLLVSVDEMAQIIHARYAAAGMLGAALPAPADAWAIPNMLVSDAGWTSQYPPGHPLVWAAFVRVGLAWAAGPLLFGLMVGWLAASFDRLLPTELRLHGRIAALLMAVSPFALSLAATTPSHVTAGAAGAAALYAALRSTDGSRGWAAAAGAAVGVMVLARPWTGLVLGPALTLGVWLQAGGPSLAARRIGPWALGGLPFAALLFSYNASLFGSPLVLGYEALYGPAHGLGLHADPWSYLYGLREALAYSSSDLVQLGVGLLDSPLSVVLVAAAYLVVARALPRGASVVAAWALLPVAANALYWFHAPRMLFEASPAWILLAVLAVSHAYSRVPPARAGIAVGIAATLLVALPMAVTGIRARAWEAETLSRIVAPDTGGEPALVFVHAPWDERIASTLQATGMRSDSIQPILRRNDTCALHLHAVARLTGSGASDLRAIDLDQTHAPAEGSSMVMLEGGTRVRLADGNAWPAACAREAAADRFGSIALAPLLWQGDLPGLEQGRPMFVRDLGPERNRAVLSAYSDRQPWVWGYESRGASPVLMPYERAMALLWGSGR
jgi:hypothetical protein